MYFVVLAHDVEDSGALDRRMATRQAHLDYIETLKISGQALIGGAMLNEADKMNGSLLIYNVSDRAALDAVLKAEPYIAANVWGDIEIIPFSLGPSFADLVEK